MKQLTKDLLDRYKDLPNNAYLDSRELQQLLDVKCLGLHIRYGYLPAPSEKHKVHSRHYRNKSAPAPIKVRLFSPSNTKIYWQVGVLRAFVSLTEDTAVEALQQLSSSIARASNTKGTI